MTATLEQLVKVRSQSAKAVLDYLTQLVDKLDQTLWRRDGENEKATLKASDIAVEPFVLTMQKRQSRRDEERQEAKALSAKRSPIEEIEAERYELPTNLEEREEKRWHQVIGRGHKRLGLKGAPGSGKTFTSRNTMAEIARQSLAAVDGQKRDIEEVEVPIWVTAQTLAQAQAGNIADALIEALANSLALTLTPNVREWLGRAIDSPRAFIFVDALDEIREAEQSAFQAKARWLDGLQARVIVSCRTMQWMERSGWLAWSSLTEVELAPFKIKQKREFASKFFVHQASLAQSMTRLLQANLSLSHACTTPLLLTFACLLHEEGKVNESTTYSKLYGLMLRKMMSGEWRGFKPSWSGDNVSSEDCLDFLAGTAWKIFSTPQSVNRFTLKDWKRAAREALEVGETAPLDAADLLRQLEQLGLLVFAGVSDDDLGSWSFGHRTFLEFLAAKGLSDKREWLAEAKQHFWFEPEWLEVLKFLAGLVDDATPLIEAVAEEQKNDDLFGSMLYLQARLIGAAKEIDEPVVERVCREVLSFWHGTLNERREALREFVLPMFSTLSMRQTTSNFLVDALLMWMNYESPYSRGAAARALGAIGDPRAVEALLKLANDENSDVRLAAAYALGATGDPRAVEALLRLMNDEAEHIRSVAAGALGATGDPRAVDALLMWMNDEAEHIRQSAAEALGAIADPRAVEALLMLTNDKDSDVRRAATRALGATGDPRAVEALLKLANDEESYVRAVAAHALGATGDPRAVDALLMWMNDEAEHIRQSAAEALGAIADPRAVEALLMLTNDKDSDVRRAATRALGATGDPRAVEALLKLANDEESYVRAVAAHALGATGDPRAVDALLMWMNDEAEHIRQSAAEALGAIADPRAVEALLMLTNDKDSDVRRAATRALGATGDPRAVEALLMLANDKDWDVRGAAARALGATGDPRAVDALLMWMNDENPYVRSAAARALGAIGDPRAVEALLMLANDKNSDVRGEAVKALWKISWKNKKAVRISVTHDGN